jgi:hypothetical protein
MEAPTELYELTSLSLGLTGHVNLFLDVKLITHSYPTAATVYKRPPTLQAGVRDHFPLHHMNFSSSLLTPLQPLFVHL